MIGSAEVRVWEESVVIPTYKVGKPNKNPMFLENGFTREVVVRYTRIL